MVAATHKLSLRAERKRLHISVDLNPLESGEIREQLAVIRAGAGPNSTASCTSGVSVIVRRGRRVDTDKV